MELNHKDGYEDPTKGHRRKENETWEDWWLRANNLYWYHEKQVIPVEYIDFMRWRYDQKFNAADAVGLLRGVRHAKI